MSRFIIILALSTTLVGCVSSSKSTPVIPRRGEMVAQGTGVLSFRSPAKGLVSVYDINTNSIVHSSAVGDGTLVTLNPQAGNISVTDAKAAGTQVVHTGVNKSHRYEMWFIPAGASTQTWYR